VGRASGRKRARRAGAAAQGELPISPPPPAPMRLRCGCWDRPELYSKTCPQHQAQAEALSDAREDREARTAAKEFPPALGLLEVAVPMWIEQFRPLAWEERMRIRDEVLDVIAGDKGLGGIEALATDSRPKKAGMAALAFNALAKALALGALQPGGVKFAGMQWDASEAPP
jgi:hypothetical protein